MAAGSSVPVSTEMKAILSGQVDLDDLQDVPSRVIRVFLASTSTDMVHERNALVENVYRRLREYAREKYGLEFQMVDLQWGMENVPPVDHSLQEFHMKEINKCKDMSVGPCFVALLGQKYGPRPLPNNIPKDEYDLIRTTLRKHRNRDTREASILDHWYKKDQNARPPVYVLQPVKSIISNINHQNQSLHQEANKQWEDIEKKMRRMFEVAADYCVKEGTMDASTRHLYHMSGLDNELQQGLGCNTATQETCQVYMRTIVDLNNYVNDGEADRYLDIIFNEKLEKFEVDKESERLIGDLSTRRVPKWLHNTNIQTFNVLWKYEDGINPHLHKSYLDQLTQVFHTNMVNMIDASARSQTMTQSSALFDEVHTHWLMCKARCENFQGQEQILDRIRDYIFLGVGQPFVIYGETGSGKTSIMARAAYEVANWLPGHLTTIVRFAGLTPGSMGIRSIINSICVQLATIDGHDITNIPTEFKEMLNYFYQLIKTYPEDKNLVIFLDSLDQLTADDQAHFMYWLPKELPDNVRLLVSVLPDRHNILNTLRNEVVSHEDNFEEIQPLHVEACMELLQSHLRGNRTIDEDQVVIAQEAFSRCGLPLYVRVLASEAEKWKSYDEFSLTDLPGSIKEYIHGIFDRLEKKHGKTLVSHALAYMTASYTGLSDCEMEDILSLDEEVLQGESVSNLPVRRLQPIKWLHIKSDIEDFLTRRESEGMTVYCWYHRLFTEVATERYLSDDCSVKKVHACLAEYFLGTWAGKKKPFPKSEALRKSNLFIDDHNEADRLVLSQPLTFQASENITRYNRRKYDQVPRHLYLSGQLAELNQLVLFNYNWLYNKTKALSLQHILTDLGLNPGEEATLMENALKSARGIIENSIDSMACEITGRLLLFYQTHENIRHLINQCDTSGLKHCGFVPNFPFHEIPGVPLQFSIDMHANPQFFQLARDSRFVVTKDRDDQYVRIFDLATGEHTNDILTSTGDMHSTPDGNFIVIADHESEKAIKVHNADDGHFLGQLIPMNQIQLKAKEKYRMGKISVSNDFICLTVTTETSYLCIADVHSCRFLQLVGLEGRANICQITPDSRYVFTNSGKKLLTYDLNSLEQVEQVQLRHQPVHIIITSDSSKAFLINGVEKKINVMHLHNGQIEMNYAVSFEDPFLQDSIGTIKLSHKEEYLLVQGLSTLVVYNTTQEILACKFHRPKDIPIDFKLPRSGNVDLNFTDTHFSKDDELLFATIFRNIYVWHLGSGRQVTCLQAPVGILTSLLVPHYSSQIVTHTEGSTILHVWNLDEAIKKVAMMDRLTGRVEKILFTSDDKLAFVLCHDSDEVGVIDMCTGQLQDLLTHSAPVTDLSITPDGQFAFVSIKPKKTEAINKIWGMKQRKILHEFGSVAGYSIALRNTNSIIHICQEDLAFKAPFYVTHYHMNGNNVDKFQFDVVIKFVLAQPFVTPEDRYVVFLTAEEYHHSKGVYHSPTIMALALNNNGINSFGPNELEAFVNLKRILAVRPCPKNSYSVVVFYTNEEDDGLLGTSGKNNGCVTANFNGFMILDVCSGVVTQVCDNFLAPFTPMDERLLITNDITLCIDDKSNILDMTTGYFVKQLIEDSVHPQRLALDGRVLVYFENNYLFAVRLVDGIEIARCDVHSSISCVEVGKDDRTVVAGCHDGTIVSYVLIDETCDNASEIISKMPSRQLTMKNHKDRSRTWDKIDLGVETTHSRSLSALTLKQSDKTRLSHVKPMNRNRPYSDTRLYMNSRSTTCSVM